MAIVVGAAMLACLVGVIVDPAADQSWGPLGVLMGTLTAGSLMMLGARRLGEGERRAWTLIGGGIFAAGVGVLAVGISLTMGNEPPAFGPLDVFFVGGYMLFIVGASLLPQVTGTWRNRLRTSLDGLVGAVSVGALSWVFFLGEIWADSARAPSFDRVVGMLYPALDTTILIVLMLITVKRGAYRFDIRMVWVSIGYVALTVGDLSYFAAGAGQPFSEVQPNFLVYIVAIGCFVGASSVVSRAPQVREYDAAKTPWWAMVLPYGLAVAMGALLAVHVVLNSNSRSDGVLDTDVLLLLSTLLVVALVVVRQAVAIQENRALVEAERSALVSSISHELRTPLTSMIGFLELLESDQGELNVEERSEFTDIVRDQAHYMGRIVMDLVLLSRDDHKKIALREEEVEAGALVRTAVTAMGGNAERISIDLETGLQLNVDGDRVVQMLTNLLTNAIRYGSGKVLLRLSRQDGGLFVEVHDNGPGVPKKHQLVIWDRFERGAHRYSSTVRGSGIGLAIVAAIVSAHSGSYGYKASQLLGGACFWFKLPGRLVNPSPRHTPRGSTDRSRVPSASGHTAAHPDRYKRVLTEDS